MLQNIKKRNKGFTIIEVLIVLAIAGLIMLIVFLAVPALRRNSNNSVARNDASKILAAVSESVANSNGVLPANNADATDLAGAANTKQTVKVVDTGANVVAPAIDTVQIVKQVKCTDPTPTVTGAIPGIVKGSPAVGNAPAVTGASTMVTAGTARQYVILFHVELSSGKYQVQCLSN